MNKYRAPTSGNTWTRIVIDLYDEIVEIVLAHQPSSGHIRCTGNDVVGRRCLSARHQSCLSRKLPRGVPPSPSRLLALMPPRPSATGNASIPAMSQPRLESPALRRTVMRDKDLLGIVTDRLA